MTLLKFSWLAPEVLGHKLAPHLQQWRWGLAVVVVDPQQDEQVDQVIGLLGGRWQLGSWRQLLAWRRKTGGL